MQGDNVDMAIMSTDRLPVLLYKPVGRRKVCRPRRKWILQPIYAHNPSIYEESTRNKYNKSALINSSYICPQ